jgi:hypothetical protein
MLTCAALSVYSYMSNIIFLCGISMICRNILILLGITISLLVALPSIGVATPETHASPADSMLSPQPQASAVPVPNSHSLHLDLSALEEDLVAGLRSGYAPDDPCLPKLYKNWEEFGADAREHAGTREFAAVRIVLDRSNFTLTLEGVKSDGVVQEIYRSPVGLGDVNSPTPKGGFVINHIYAYPDVLFFGAVGDPVSGLYNGFFAPLLACDENGRCQRYCDLGIHGFKASAHPHRAAITVGTRGAVSAGCIRVPDPCRLKSLLIGIVGVGPLKKNDRGSYHWLARPVEVRVTGDYPGTRDQITLVQISEESINQVQGGLKGLLDLFGP